ncbi:MAG: phosphatidylglycerol lysyltransferase domain-containing protein [Candidatus Margulisiibacteriota bacterium]
MIPTFPEFKRLTQNDRLWVAKHLKHLPRHVCELTLGNLFIWEEFDRPQATCLNGNICLLITPPVEPPYFLEPLGREKLVETITTCLERGFRVSRISEDCAALLPSEKFELAELRSQFDYIYLRSDLAGLKGKKYDGKRNHIKRFRARHPEYIFEPLQRSDKASTLALFEQWFKLREESKFFPRLAYVSQKTAINNAFKWFQELHLFGCALRLEGKLLGFTLASELNPEMVSLHFMYGDPAYPGISQVMLWEAANKCYSGYKFLNLEQDLGIPGLRSAKLSWQPVKLEKKFEVKLKP